MRVENSWVGFGWCTRSQEKHRDGDIPPERTPSGDFVFFHGTSPAAAEAIGRELRLAPDGVNAVGVGSRPEDVAVYGRLHTRVPVVLRVVIAACVVGSARIKHEIGGSGANQWLFLPPYGSCGRWVGVPLENVTTVRWGDG